MLNKTPSGKMNLKEAEMLLREARRFTGHGTKRNIDHQTRATSTEIARVTEPTDNDNGRSLDLHFVTGPLWLPE